jgi:predicted DCC family thiol-disulfide oxidoreductase YuxK
MIEVLRVLRLTAPAAHIVDRIPDALLDRAYTVVARHRSSLGRLVPDRPGPLRFP